MTEQIITPAADLPPGATPAPAPTPAVETPAAETPVVEAPVVTETITPTPELTVEVPFKTGNDTFDSIGNVLAKAGVTNANAALAELADKGALSLETKAALLLEGDSAIVSLAIAQAESEIGRLKESAVSIKTGLMEHAKSAFGGEDAQKTWDEMGAFFTQSTEFTDGERASLNQLLSNEETGKFAINEIATRYRMSAGFAQPADLMQGDRGTGTNFEPIGKADYITQMRDAQQKFGEGSREVEGLRNRRTLSKQRGF